MINDSHDLLISYFTGGLDKPIEIPISAGIVGYTATTGEVLNIQDAYDDPRFSRATDMKTGYRTQSVLCVPIFDHKGSIYGVTEMINKFNGFFNEEDESVMNIFNIFCGISIQNARLYRASIELSMQLRSFMEISMQLGTQQTIKKLLEEILRNTRKVIGAITCAMFMVDDDGLNYTPYVIDQDVDAKLAAAATQEKDARRTGKTLKRMVISRLLNSTASKVEVSESSAARNKILDHVISSKESVLENYEDKPDESLIVVPIVNSDRVVTGAVLIQSKRDGSKFTFEEQKLLESYSIFISVSLERYRAKAINQYGIVEYELSAQIRPLERKTPGLPMRYTYSDAVTQRIFAADFDAARWTSRQLFGVIFNVFEEFVLLQTYQIPSEVFYHILFTAREAHTFVSPAAWEAAIGDLQFLAVALQGAPLDKHEVLCLFIAVLMRGCGYRAASRAETERSAAPLALLFGDRSNKITSQHCIFVVDVLTREKCNFIDILAPDDRDAVWRLLVPLVLQSAVAAHAGIVAAAKVAREGGDWKIGSKTRFTVLQLLYVAAQYSVAARARDAALAGLPQLFARYCEQLELHSEKRAPSAASEGDFLASFLTPLFDELALLVPGAQVFQKAFRENVQAYLAATAPDADN
jgi:GAF domain-containing protein